MKFITVLGLVAGGCRPVVDPVPDDVPVPCHPPHPLLLRPPGSGPDSAVNIDIKDHFQKTYVLMYCSGS